MSYIGVDWGSSSFRAYRFSERAGVVGTVVGGKGILRIENGDFEGALFQLLGPLLEPGDRLLFSGMITSRNGWIETPYAELPASIEGYLAGGLRQRFRGVEMIFLPGVCQLKPADVMRGEELQIFGVCAGEEDATVILPGTHSKWVQVKKGVITGFKTVMTGEIYDLLMNRSLIGKIAEAGDHDEAAFLEGVGEGARAYPDQSMLASLFTARAAVLLDQLEARQVASYLSGLLIGSEAASGLRAAGDRGVAPLIIGDELLCSRYGTALKALGCGAYQIKADASIQGFARLIEILVR